jgi:hypothetical protein
MQTVLALEMQPEEALVDAAAAALLAPGAVEAAPTAAAAVRRILSLSP